MSSRRFSVLLVGGLSKGGRGARGIKGESGPSPFISLLFRRFRLSIPSHVGLFAYQVFLLPYSFVVPYTSGCNMSHLQMLGLQMGLPSRPRFIIDIAL
uniref:Uncharacterized protein n=1 Tax=Bursaphelenchus xylophilus TaxID=6326 RepID=A0A1I7RQZ9_BURXY